jgi:hypothetical protein
MQIPLSFISTPELFYVGFEVLTAVSMKMAVDWVVAPCSLVDLYETTRRYNPEDSHLQNYFMLIFGITNST